MRLGLITVALFASSLSAASQAVVPPPAPIRVSAAVMTAMLVSRVEPVYPEAAASQHISGAVVLHTFIGSDGRVRSASVVTGPEIFRAPALLAVQQWTYRPYLLNGRPVEVDTIATLQFGDATQTPAPASYVGGVMGGTGTPAQMPSTLPPGRVRISAGVMATQLIKRVWPVRPTVAKEQRVSGAVVMHVVIGRDGRVQEISVISGPQMLRESYVDAVRQWEYKPYLLNGEPVEVETQITEIMDFGG